MDVEFDEISDALKIRSYEEIVGQKQDEEGFETATTTEQVCPCIKMQIYNIFYFYRLKKRNFLLYSC